MHILVRDLYEDRSCFVQQTLSDEKSISQIPKVGMNSKFPSVTECLYLFGLSGKFVISI
jgi:hypothetical protein